MPRPSPPSATWTAGRRPGRRPRRRPRETARRATSRRPPQVLEARRPGPRGGDRQAARLGRAGLPARLRPPGGQPRRLLGPAPAVPVHPGLAVRAVVGALPRARPAPPPRWPGRPNGTPGCCPPRPSRSPGRPAAAATPATRRRATAPARGRRHDRPDRPAEQALAYARHGWPVFPCKPGSKEPATRHGFKDATTDPDKITWWWRRQPGRQPRHRDRRARPDVLDVDQHGPAGNGFAAFNKLEPRRPGRAAPARSSPRPAAACTPTSPAPTSPPASCPATTSTSAPRAATSSPRPRRSAASPTGSSATRPKPGGLDWDKAVALLEPQRQAAARPASAQRGDLGHLAGWVAGWQPDSQTATTACSGPPAGPPKPATSGPGRAGGRRPVDRAHRPRDRRDDRVGPPHRRAPF